MAEIIAVYPGSFDPVTNGHLDIVQRSVGIFDRVVVAILRNPAKKAAFPVRQRVAFLREATASLPKVEVDSFSGLLVEYARRKGASVIVRGLRAVSDFEYEFQMALMNRKLDDTLETVFMMPREDYAYVSSGLVREVAALGGEIGSLVPPAVERALRGGRR